MKSAMKAMSFLVLSAVLVGCDGLPLVTIFQLDLKHQTANPKKIVKWDMDKCVAVIEPQAAIPLLSPELHGAFCLTAEDAGKWKAHMQAECRKRNENAQLREENSLLRAELNKLRELLATRR